MCSYKFEFLISSTTVHHAAHTGSDLNNGCSTIQCEESDNCLVQEMEQHQYAQNTPLPLVFYRNTVVLHANLLCFSNFHACLHASHVSV